MTRASNPSVASEVLELLDQFAATVEGYGFVQRPENEPSFGMVNLLDEYDARAAIQLLTTNAPSYYGHKEATLYAFCGWAIAPFESDVRFDLVGIAIKELLSHAEKKATSLNLDSRTAADMLARYYFAGSQFMSDIYSGFQGASSFLAFGSGAFIEQELTPLTKDYKTIMKLMACCHYVSKNLVSPKRKPSVNFAMRFLEANNDEELKSSTAAYPMWGLIKENVSYVYAASSIQVTRSQTLLDAILTNDLKFSDLRFFRTWMRRTKFICETVLKEMSEDLYAANSLALADIEPEPFLPHLESDELNIINSALKKA